MTPFSVHRSAGKAEVDLSEADENEVALSNDEDESEASESEAESLLHATGIDQRKQKRKASSPAGQASKTLKVASDAFPGHARENVPMLEDEEELVADDSNVEAARGDDEILDPDVPWTPSLESMQKLFEESLKVPLTLGLNLDYYVKKLGRPIAPLTKLAIREAGSQLQTQGDRDWCSEPTFDKLVKVLLQREPEERKWRVSVELEGGVGPDVAAHLLPRAMLAGTEAGPRNSRSFIFRSVMAAELFLDDCNLKFPNEEVKWFRREYKLEGTGMLEVARVLDTHTMLNPGRLVFLFGEMSKELLSVAGDKIERVLMLPRPSLEMVVEVSNQGSLLGFFPPVRSWSGGDRLPAVFRAVFSKELGELGGEDEAGVSSSSALGAAEDGWERNARTLESAFGPGEACGLLRVYSRERDKGSTVVVTRRRRSGVPLAVPRRRSGEVVATRRRPSGVPYAVAECQRARAAMALFNHFLEIEIQAGSRGNFHAKISKPVHDMVWLRDMNRVEFIGHVPGVEVGEAFETRGKLVTLKLQNQQTRGVATIIYEGGLRVANAVVESRHKFKPNGFVYEGSSLDTDSEALVNSCRLNLPVRVISKVDKMFVYQGLFAVTRFWGPNACSMEARKKKAEIKAGKKKAEIEKKAEIKAGKKKAEIEKKAEIKAGKKKAVAGNEKAEDELLPPDRFMLEPCNCDDFKGNQYLAE